MASQRPAKASVDESRLAGSSPAPSAIRDDFEWEGERKHAGIRLDVSACERADTLYAYDVEADGIAVGPWVRIRIDGRWYRVERLSANGFIYHCSTCRFKKALQLAQGLARICRVREANGHLSLTEEALC